MEPALHRAARKESDGDIALEDPMTQPSTQQRHTAERSIVSGMRWQRRPAPQAGMGGIFPGEGPYGRVNYPYTNSLKAYYFTMSELLRGQSVAAASTVWRRHMRHVGLPSDAPGQDGATRALRVWQSPSQVPSIVRIWLRGSPGVTTSGGIRIPYEWSQEDRNAAYDWGREVASQLKRYLSQEMRRTGLD